MKETVCENKYYKIDIDIERNCLIIKPIGFWRSPNVVPNYLETIEDTIKYKLKSKFAVILDATSMLIHPREVQEEIHLKGLKMIMEFKPLVWIKVLPIDNSVAIMQSDYLGRLLGTGRKIETFHSVEQAELYLDKYKSEHLL